LSFELTFFDSINFQIACEGSYPMSSPIRNYVAMHPKDQPDHRRVYSIIKKIGRGGSCKVFQVMDDRQQFYALKRVERTSTSESIYAREISILQRDNLRNHPLIINLREVGLSENYIYLVLELGSKDLKEISARILREFVNRVSQASSEPECTSEIRDYFAQVSVFWRQILKAVQAAHDAGVIHCDLKPANFVNIDGVLKLIDFGISKELQNDFTHVFLAADKIQGSLYYISPEAVNVQQGGVQLRMASDVWSLGCMLYQMVYGYTPFRESRMDTVVQKLRKKEPIAFPAIHPVLPRVTIPESVISILRKCLTYDYTQRPTIGELLSDPILYS
jgi:serine/threonine-protein kinase TTK/MPS1